MKYFSFIKPIKSQLDSIPFHDEKQDNLIEDNLISQVER